MPNVVGNNPERLQMRLLIIIALLTITLGQASVVARADTPTTQAISKDDLQKLIEKANQGNADAQYSLGFMYANGQGVPQNYPVAIEWLSKAADQGNGGAEYGLGYMYANAQGVSEDDGEAGKWFRKAAEQGVEAAQYTLGSMYANGQRGVSKDFDEAVKWLSKAAEQGNRDAQYLLGLQYKSAQGENQDYVQAYAWLSVAASQGNTDAASVRDKLVHKMADYQITKAKRLSQEYNSYVKKPSPEP
jgi:TPR repeat protein